MKQPTSYVEFFWIFEYDILPILIISVQLQMHFFILDSTVYI